MKVRTSLLFNLTSRFTNELCLYFLCFCLCEHCTFENDLLAHHRGVSDPNHFCLCLLCICLYLHWLFIWQHRARLRAERLGSRWFVCTLRFASSAPQAPICQQNTLHIPEKIFIPNHASLWQPWMKSNTKFTKKYTIFKCCIICFTCLLLFKKQKLLRISNK